MGTILKLMRNHCIRAYFDSRAWTVEQATCFFVGVVEKHVCDFCGSYLNRSPLHKTNLGLNLARPTHIERHSADERHDLLLVDFPTVLVLSVVLSILLIVVSPERPSSWLPATSFTHSEYFSGGRLGAG